MRDLRKETASRLMTAQHDRCHDEGMYGAMGTQEGTLSLVQTWSWEEAAAANFPPSPSPAARSAVQGGWVAEVRRGRARWGGLHSGAYLSLQGTADSFKQGGDVMRLRSVTSNS